MSASRADVCLSCPGLLLGVGRRLLVSCGMEASGLLRTMIGEPDRMALLDDRLTNGQQKVSSWSRVFLGTLGAANLRLGCG